MTRHTRSTSGTNSGYPHGQQPLPLAQSPMFNPQRINMAPTYYAMPAVSPSMQMPPQQQQQLQQHHQQSFDPYSMPTNPAQLPPTQHRPSSGAWSAEDDIQLSRARAGGLNWNQIKISYFPNKTANACRKRHERLAEKRDDDWDTRKLQRLAKEYMTIRKEIWSGLAQRTGEKWSVVEQKCMSNGLKNLQSAARAASRYDRARGQSLSGQASASLTGYDDDSGISGIGLTPVDELDASYSSPESGSSGAVHSASSSTASAGLYPQLQQQHHQQQHHPHSHHHHQQQHQHHQHQHQLQQQQQQHHYAQQQHVQHNQIPLQALTGSGANASLGGYSLSFSSNAPYHPQHGYSSSVSSTASGQQGYVGGTGNSTSSSPYIPGQRLPSADMGISSIMNRPGGGGGGV